MDPIDWADDASKNWYILAEDEHDEYLLIDLGEKHNGRCYDGFHETYGLVGDMRAIASSFTDLLCRLLKNPGSRHYWLT